MGSNLANDPRIEQYLENTNINIDSDTGRDDLAVLIRTLIYAIRDPVWLDIITNAKRAILVSGSTTAVTGSLTSAGTVSTVATVTSVTNQVSAGGWPLDMATVNFSETDWGVTTRSLLI